MNARGAALQNMLEGTKQYVIPLFQRPYSWEKKEWNELWDDLLEVYDSVNSKEHFIGSIVTIPFEPTPAGVSKFTLIDGQQRLTTVLILLSAIRELASELLHDHENYRTLPEKISE